MIINATALQQSITIIQGALKVLTALQLTASEYPDQTCVYDGECFDYIIVGAGTAGCVLANRLVADGNTTVLLIEAGDIPQIQSDIPALMLYLKSSDDTWSFKAQDPGVLAESHKPTDDDLSQGRVLGGSSSLSYLIYSTGAKSDYDNWASIVNDSIWNYENVLPYLKKSQRLENPITATDREAFGQNGNIGLTILGSAGTIDVDPYFKIFQEAGNNIDSTLYGTRILGYANAMYTISDNLRQNTALTYLMPIMNNPNLRVLQNSLVKRIVFDCNNTAMGVEVYACNDRHIFLKARKEVIVSAGVINTPKLLMLSGIGPKEHLCKHKIRSILDLPVGEGLQDHLGVTLVYNMTKLVVTYRPFNPYEYPATVLIGNVALNKSSNYPDYQSVSFVNFPQYLMRYCTFTYFFNDTICNSVLKTSINSQMMFVVLNKQKFRSRGKVLLKSHRYEDEPLIYTRYYADNQDLEDHARIIQDYVRIEDTKTFKQLGGQFKDPNLPQCGKMDKNNLEYWKCYVLHMVSSQHQYSSTCPMGSVVDSRLRVYGTKRLRVVDASIMPNPTAGGTLGSTIMIGEKAADLIKEDRDKLD